MKPFLTALVVGVLGIGAFANVTDPSCKGVIHGVATNDAGQVVADVQVVLDLLEVGSSVSPATRTNVEGEYRFEHVCTGRFIVLVDDERAGYPPYYYQLVLVGKKEVELTPERLEAELSVHVPLKAASLEVVARDSRTKAPVPALEVMLKTSKVKMYDWITLRPDSRGSLLVPANTDFFCRVRAEGYREWPGCALPGIKAAGIVSAWWRLRPVVPLSHSTRRIPLSPWPR